MKEVKLRSIPKWILAFRLLSVGVCLLFLLSALPASKVSAAQTIPYKINMQGRLTDQNGNILADGLYNVKFRIMDAASNGNNLYEEARVIGGADNRIAVTNGLFNIQLGEVNTALSPSLFNTTAARYLEVEMPTPATATCAVNACAVFTEGAFTPRQPFAASTYAFNADQLDGIDGSQYARNDTANTFTGSNTFQPTTNVSSVLVKQNSSGSFGQDIFAVQGSSSGNFIQVSSTAANQGAITIQSLGSNALTLESGGALNIGTSNVAHTINVGNTGATGTQAITIGGTGNTTNTATIQGGTGATAVNLVVASGGTINIGNTSVAAILDIGAVDNDVASTVNVNSRTGGTTTKTTLVGSTDGASVTTIQAGTGNLTLLTNAATASTIIKSGINSTVALQVQNSSGTNVVQVDTTDANLIPNPGAESALGSEWPTTGTGTNTTVSRTTTTAWSGAAALQVVVTPTTANAGARNFLGAALTANTDYTVSFYAKLKAGDPAFTDISVQYYRNNTPTLDASCTNYNTQTIVSTGWTRVTCLIHSSVTAGAATAYVQIYQAATAARTFYIDGLQVEQKTNIATAYGAGNIRFNATVTSSMAFRNIEDSTTALLIQNATGTNLLAVDTLNTRIHVGPLAGDTTGAVLVLGNKTNAGDPTGVNGGMYYNSSMNVFRCYQENFWRDCIPTTRNTVYYVNEMWGGSNGTDNFGSSGPDAENFNGSVAPVAAHPGINTQATGSTATGEAWITNANGSALLLGNGDTWRYEEVMRLPALSTATQEYTIRLGFIDSGLGETTDGCFFRYKRTLSVNWIGVCHNNYSTVAETTCNTGVAVTAATWNRMGVVVNGTPTADFRINGISRCTISTGIPTAAGRDTAWGSQISKNAGTANAAMDVDYIEVVGQMGTSR